MQKFQSFRVETGVPGVKPPIQTLVPVEPISETRKTYLESHHIFMTTVIIPGFSMKESG